MIKLFITIGVIGVGLFSYLATIGQGPDYQMSPSVSLLERFQAEGVVPGANEVVENEEIEHGIFEVPAEDEVRLKKAMSMGGMSGMDPGGMKMPMDTDDKKPMDMAMDGKDKATTKMPMGTDDKKPMDMAMDGKEDGSEGGLKITETGTFDREVDITMAEWKFSRMKIDVKSGEKIRFTVTNGGKIPHEFMFMSMPAMMAVNYRAKRADWNLLEHEALFEKSLVLPGGKFSFVAQVKENGAWMFMCMLPYHMQMGMMGQMATPGMAMDMKM